MYLNFLYFLLEKSSDLYFRSFQLEYSVAKKLSLISAGKLRS